MGKHNKDFKRNRSSTEINLDSQAKAVEEVVSPEKEINLEVFEVEKTMEETEVIESPIIEKESVVEEPTINNEEDVKTFSTKVESPSSFFEEVFSVSASDELGSEVRASVYYVPSKKVVALLDVGTDVNTIRDYIVNSVQGGTSDSFQIVYYIKSHMPEPGHVEVKQELNKLSFTRYFQDKDLGYKKDVKRLFENILSDLVD